jgi:hypothetical protein
MLTKALLGILTLELLSEIFSTVASIATPAWALQLFNVPVLPETIALTFVLGLVFGFVTVIIGLAIYFVFTGSRMGWLLSYVLGMFWIVFGGSLAMVYGKIENLYLDFLPGLIITTLTYFSARRPHGAGPPAGR